MWPFQKRGKEFGSNFTEQTLVANTDRIDGVAGDGTALAAVQFAAWLVGRSFAQAPAQGSGLPASVRELIGRQLVLAGEVALIREDKQWIAASTFDVRGNALSPAAWSYRLDIASPSRSTEVYRTGDAVLHPRICVDPQSPWRGIPPWQKARLTLETALACEVAATDAARMPTLTFLDLQNFRSSTVRGDEELKIRGALRQKKKLFFFSSRGGNKADQQRVAPAIDSGLAQLRKQASLEILEACGIPGTLFDLTGEGTGRREAFRQFSIVCLEPLGSLVSSELQDKFAIETEFDFTALHASDIQGKARAVANLVKAGLGIDEALGKAGLN